MVYLVFSKGGREGGLLPGKKSFNLERNAQPMQIMEGHGNYPSSPGICGAFVCLFVFFQNHCNCPTVGAGGREFIQRPDPWITLKLHFITSAEREVKDSRRSGMYQSCNFLTRLGKQSL